MSPSTLFDFANFYAFFGWFLLFSAPNWKHTQTIVKYGILVVLGLIYSILVLKGIMNFNVSDFSTLSNVKQLFSKDEALLAGWIHYLCFDLFVGAYIVRKSKELNISRLIYSLILPFTFMFGPVGFVIFTLVSLSKSKH
jgi:predicted small secreted protein